MERKIKLERLRDEANPLRKYLIISPRATVKPHSRGWTSKKRSRQTKEQKKRSAAHRGGTLRDQQSEVQRAANWPSALQF